MVENKYIQKAENHTTYIYKAFAGETAVEASDVEMIVANSSFRVTSDTA